ncbi:MAG: hypothetical protein AAF585_18585 [Verrucomicrobiota bacterium]
MNENDGDVWEEERRKFSDLIGLKELAPEHVFRAALEDESYAYELMVASQDDDPQTLEFWLNRAPSSGGQGNQESTLRLAGRAAKALLRWSATGFTRVDEETLERRRQACLKCPLLSEPESWAQKLVAGKPRPDLPDDIHGKVCGACHCSLSKKIHLPSENCPKPDPEIPGVSRWGEAIA